MPTIPVKIEPIAKLAKRFPKAMAKVWDVGTVTEDLPIGDRAGKHPENIFDVEDGPDQFRFIISRDKHENEEVLHVSISVIKTGREKTLVQRVRQLQGILEIICGRALPTPLGDSVSPGNVLHLFFPVPEPVFPRRSW